MERLTIDNPQNNFQTLMNYAYAKDGAVHLTYGEGVEDVGLCEYISMMCGCHSVKSPQDVMDGSCMECDCQFAILNAVATQAAELRGRLKAIEDILGPTYDLSRLNELVEADREGRVKIYPCKVGDTVYAQNFIGGNDVLELFVEKVSADKEKVRTTTKANGIGMYAEYDWKMFREKTYKTRESAEKALEVQYGTD